MNLLLVATLGVRLLFQNQSDTLTNVIISASRSPIPSQQVTVSHFKTKISQETVNNTPDLFRDVPGVFLQKTNLGGGSPFLRGLAGNQTLIILDGIRFNNSTFRYGPNQYLNSLDVFNLDNLEVIKGSGAVQYGSDALTGVIQLLSQKPSFSDVTTWKGNVLTRWASNGMELSQHGKIAYQSKNNSYLLSAGLKNYGDIIRGGEGGYQHPTGYYATNLQAVSRHKLGKNWQLENALQQNVQEHVPVFHKVALENYETNEMSLQKYQRASSKLVYSSNLNWIKSFEIIASYQRSQEARTLKKNNNLTTRKEEDIVQTIGISAQVKSQILAGVQSINGIEYYKDVVNSSRVDVNASTIVSLRGLFPDQSTYATLAAFSLHQFQIKPFFIQTGLRFQEQFTAIPDTTVGALKHSFGAFVYDVGASLPINSNLTFFTSLASGFRAPNLDDLGSLGIVDFRYELPAYNLKPEYSLNKNMGIRCLTSKWSSEFSIFHTQITNLISRIKTQEVIQNYPVYRKENVDNAYLYGFEWNQNIQITPRFQVSNQLSYVYGQNQTQNEPMRRIPPLYGNIALTYRLDKLKMGVQWQFAARQDRLSAADKSDNRMNPTGTPGWGILKLTGDYTISSQIRLSAQLENLGNVLYRMHGSGIDGMGRSAHVQISYNW